MTQRDGFTLVELLVVITVISILMGIMLPVFAHVRENGRRTKCSHNLGQVHHALEQYAEDYRSWYPPTIADSTSMNFDSSDVTNEVVNSSGKEIGLGRMWMDFIAEDDNVAFDQLIETVTCPSTDYWHTVVPPSLTELPDPPYYCSYLYRGGGAPVSGTRMITQGDLDVMTKKIGRVAIATDANHERPGHTNHTGKLNITAYGDGSVARKDLPGSGLSTREKMIRFVDGG